MKSRSGKSTSHQKIRKLLTQQPAPLLGAFISKVKKSLWLFPLLLAIPLIALTLLKVHGSSIGIYHRLLHGSEAHDPNLLYGKPQPIRSDEWLGSTQFTIRQEKIGFPAYDDGLGSGRDVTKHPDNPTKDWVTLFRPHNWSFFVMPLENAFAFRWWFIAYILIVSCYFFILRILPERKLFAAIMALSFALSPYLIWWYQSALLMTLAYGFMIIIVGIRIVDQEKLRYTKSQLTTNVIYGSLLAYLGASMALLLYPPFGISILLVVASYLLGYMIHQKFSGRLNWTRIGKRVLFFLLAALAVVAILLLFASQHKEMFERTAEALYPGQRQSVSGGLAPIAILDGFLMPLLQRSEGGAHYYSNQSNASNFILLLPFIIIPALLLQVNAYRKRRYVDWVFLALTLCGALFFLRSFVAFGDKFYELLLLSRVPTERMIAGMGFLGIIYLLLLIKKLPKAGITQQALRRYSLLYGVACVGAMAIIGKWVIDRYPLFLSSYVLMAGFALLFTSIIVAFLMNKKYLGAVLLLVFSIGSTFKIMPLYRGLDVVTKSEVIQRIDEVSEPGDKWITTDDINFINLPALAGEDQISGSQTYPDPEFWRQMDEEGHGKVYNRQARVVFISDNPSMNKFELVQSNYFQVRFECSDFMYRNVDYVLAVRALNYECVELLDLIDYPVRDFYIYKINGE